MFQNIIPTINTTAQGLFAFAENKKIPKIIEESVLIALSHYPELRDTEIDFVFKKNIKKSVMQAQPKFSTLLRSKETEPFKSISALCLN